MLAERLHLSGIITVVVFGIAVARTTPGTTPARLRVPSFAVWEVAVFVLNVLAFMLVGLQLKPILQRLTAPQLGRYALVAGGVCAAVVLARVLWVALAELVAQWARQRAPVGRELAAYPSRRAAAVVAWSGMRGIVTLAAALALPVGSGGSAGFPERDLILFTAFSVVLFTLVLQGLSLNPLIRLLSLSVDTSVDREIQLARWETAKAGLQSLDESQAPVDDTALLRRRYEAQLRSSEADPESAEPGAEVVNFNATRREALRAERRTLFDLRARGVIGDDAFHRIEEELDWAELDATH
jgi:CPA1 family monovalent cation:H+ antiporter